jgi:HK97 family phage major capsid protein
MKLKALIEKRAALLKEREALLSKESLSDEDRAKDDELSTEIEALQSDIERLQAFHKQAKANNPPREPGQAHAVGPQYTSHEDTGNSGSGSSVTVEEPAFVKDPMKGFASVSEYLLAVRANSGGQVRDERLRYLSVERIYEKEGLQAAVGSDEQMTSSDPYGGFLVPEGMSPDMLSIRPEDDFLGQFVRRIPVDALTFKVNARVDENHSSSVSGGLTVTREPETEAGTASRMKFRQVSLEMKELVGVAHATNQVLRYTPRAFAGVLSAGFSQEFASTLINERINGNGTTEMLGVNDTTRNPALIEVAKEGSQTADTIKYENIVSFAAMQTAGHR